MDFLFRSWDQRGKMASPCSVAEPPLLGVCDGPLDVRKHRSSFVTNKVGGEADWLPGIRDRTRCCATCGSPLVHVVQVYCPLAASPYHRNIHLFACAAAECGGRADSWTALRSQGLDTAQAQQQAAARYSPPPTTSTTTATDWCESADDWGESADDWGDGEGQEGRGVTHTQTQDAEGSGRGCHEVSHEVSHEASHEVSHEVSDALRRLQVASTLPPPLRPFFVSVLEEADVGEDGYDDDDDDEHVQELLRDYERREGVAAAAAMVEGGGGGGSEEKYEKSCARHGDAAFSRFMKRIRRCPQQILRYCRGGQPLFISEPAGGPPPPPACGACGGPRTFELQLMPALVALLRDQRGEAAPLDFGTVLVYSCTRSCWRDGSRAALEELCLLQPDPDHQLFL